MNPKAWVEGVFELIWRILIRIALWTLLAYLLYRVRSILVTIMLSAILAYALLPVVDALCAYRVTGMSRKMQRFLATLFVFVALIAVLVFSVTSSITPFKNELGSISPKIDSAIAYIRTEAVRWQKSLPPDLQDFLLSQHFGNTLDKLSNWGASIAKSTYDFLSHLMEMILIPVLAFYFVLDSGTLKREFVALFPRRRTREVMKLIDEINLIMRSYVVGQIILCLIAGIFVAIMLYATDMHYELILGMFSGISRAIPVIGPIISGIVIVLVGLSRSPMLGLYFLIIFTALQFVESKIIMPKLIGDRISLHPVLVILALLIGAEFFGLFGMLIAAPAAAIIRILLRYYIVRPNHAKRIDSHTKASDNLDSEERINSEK
jgi:predicted PurR-regulated permease PerM